MAKMDRGRFTLSTNVILTVALITRVLTFGLTMLIAYMKAKNAVFDDNVTRIMNLDTSYGMPLGTGMRSIAYSIIGVFLMEFITGILGTIGALCKIKHLIIITVLLSSVMLMIYTVYIVLLALLYDKTNCIQNTLDPYVNMYWHWNDGYYNAMYISQDYNLNVFPGFLRKLGCDTSFSAIHSCFNVYKEQVRTYLTTYFGVVITCFICHVISIVASEYTYRKLEFKEMKTGLSRNKYYLLLTLRHGIGRTFILFVRRSWRASKIVFFSTVLKITTLVVSLGLFILGLILRGDILITNGSLKHIFYQIQFYHYYFYDILIGLSASAVVLGSIGVASSILSMAASWRNSPMIKVASCVSSSVLLIPKMVVLVFWSILIVKIINNMKYQLWKQQAGYYYNYNQNIITTEWNAMILVLDCCGVYNHDDTHNMYYGTAFCCNVAHEFRMDTFGSYYNDFYGLEYYGGCGGYKTKTCSSVILWKTKMYVGFFLGIVMLLIILEIIGILLMNKEYHTEHVEGKSDITMRSWLDALKSLVSIFSKIWTGIKNFLCRYYSRSKWIIFHFVSISVVFVCSISLIANAVRIRYDEIFGNRDIRPLLSRVNITDTTLTDAIDNFSTVVITFALASLVAAVYSVAIMVPRNTNKLFIFFGIFIWTCSIIANIIDMGLWSKVYTEVLSEVTIQLEYDIKLYRYSQRSGLSYYDQTSFYLNTLFVKARCCGTNSTSNLTFQESHWFTHNLDYSNQKLPFQCCVTQGDIFPYSYVYDYTCKDTPNSYHEEGCPTTINNRLRDHYSIPFFVLTSFVLVAETVIITTTLILLRHKTSDDDKVELVSIKDIQDRTLDSVNENNISETVTTDSTKRQTIKRATSRTSMMSRSRKIEPQPNIDQEKGYNAEVSNGSRKKRERSQKNKVKKTVDKNKVNKETNNRKSEKMIESETENNNDTDVGLYGSMRDNPAIDNVREAENKEQLPTMTGNDDGNIGTLTSAWQTPGDVPDSSIRSFKPNTSIRSSIPDGSIRPAIESIHSENTVEMTNDVDVEEM